MTSTDLLDSCRRAGMQIKNQLTALDPWELKAIRAMVIKGSDDRASDVSLSAQAEVPAILQPAELAKVRERFTGLKDSLDRVIPLPSDQQVHEFGDRCLALCTAAEEHEVVTRVCDQVFNLVRLEQANHYLGCRILLECRQPLPERDQQLLGHCTELDKVIPAVKEAAAAVCLSLKDIPSVPASAGSDHPFVFRLSDGKVFQIRFGGSAEPALVPATKSLKQIRLLLQNPYRTISGLQLKQLLKAPPPRDRDDDVAEIGENARLDETADHRRSKKKVSEDEGIIAVRNRIKQIDKKLKNEGVITDRETTEREQCHAYLKKHLFNPDAYLDKNAEPQFKDRQLGEEYTAQESADRNLRNACKALAKTPSLKPLVQHLKKSIERLSKGFSYWPAEPAPNWQLD